MRRRSPFRRVAFTAATVLAWLAGSAAMAGPYETDLELAVKASYLYKLAPFVVWPATASAGGPTFVICVQGDPSFAGLVERAVAGQQFGGRAFEVRKLARVNAESGCQIAYLTGSPAQPLAQAVSALDGSGVLTVTDEAKDGRARGVVHLVRVDGRVRFDIDDVAAEREGLAISSKLLKLAVHVRTR